MNFQTSAWALVALVLLHRAFLTVYRLFFHPLAKFPGPKLVAATRAYEFYNDVVRGGLFIWRVKEMHDRYGPIVRISPHELHILDSDFFDQLYNPSGSSWDSRRRDKYGWFVSGLGLEGAMVGTVDHDLHRSRRATCSGFFSQKAVVELEPVIQDKVAILRRRLGEAAESSAVVQMDWVFNALSVDVICGYCYGADTGYLRRPDYGKEWKELMYSLASNIAVIRFVPWLLKLPRLLPETWVKTLNPKLEGLLDVQSMVRNALKPMMEGKALEKTSHRTILHELLQSKLSPHERQLDRLTDEAVQFVAAGSDSTAKLLTHMMFYLGDNPDCVSRLRQELASLPEHPSWIQLANIPYFAAVVRETLRVASISTSRQPRVLSDNMQYKEWLIPANTPVSQTPYFILHDAAIFPEPESFDPRRWLGESGKYLNRYFVAFSKGSRDCIGRNLALAEIYSVMAVICREFDFVLVDTSVEDVRTARDYLVASPADPLAGVKVMLQKRTEIDQEK